MRNSYDIVQSLTTPVGKWGAHNFDFHAPHAGVAEEAGELIHALLKSAQNIRGTGEEHRGKQKDALADMLIFAAHLRYKITRRENVDQLDISNKLMSALFINVGLLLSNPEDDHALRMLCDTVDSVAHALNINIDIITLQTWADVSKRDWRKYPKTGLPPAEHEDTLGEQQAKTAVPE